MFSVDAAGFITVRHDLGLPVQLHFSDHLRCDCAEMPKRQRTNSAVVWREGVCSIGRHHNRPNSINPAYFLQHWYEAYIHTVLAPVPNLH